jgi:HEPN domain-containing protein
MPYLNEQDKVERHINGFATQSFRDQADRDYIAARQACRADLMPQFLWSAQQAVEKYLKATLLYNRVPAKKVGHDIATALQLAEAIPKTPFEINLSARSRKFIDHLAIYGQNRYIEKPYHVNGHILVDLDLTIWELRRYCEVLNVFGKVLPEKERKLLAQALSDLAKSDAEPRHKFRVHGGFLEEVLKNPKHLARSALLWNNATFASRKRATVKVRDHMMGGNPLLYLYPEMLDELLKYVSLPGKLEQAYREHLAAIKADPSKRP